MLEQSSKYYKRRDNKGIDYKLEVKFCKPHPYTVCFVLPKVGGMGSSKKVHIHGILPNNKKIFESTQYPLHLAI
jgi:hypothetical protein